MKLIGNNKMKLKRDLGEMKFHTVGNFH